MARLSSFVIGIMVIGVVVFAFVGAMSEMYTKYNPDPNYDNASMAVYTEMEEMHNLSKQMEQSSDIEERSGIVDIIGGYFSSAYRVARISTQSFSTFDKMRNEAIKDAQLGSFGTYLLAVTGSIILVLLILGVLISGILKYRM